MHAARSVRKQSSFKKGGKGDSGDKFARGFFANRTKEHIARAKFLERRIETLLTTEKIEKPRQDWEMKLEFNRVSESSRQVLLTEDLAVGYPGHPLLENLNLTIHFGQRLVLIGSNGSGKTTLMKTLAGQLPPLAGKIRLGSSIHLGTMSQEQDEVVNESNALEAIRKQAPFSDTAARAFLHQFLFSGDDVFIPASKLSYGERARLLLAQLVAKGCNLLLLDEPINHLDIPSRSRFEKALAEFKGTVLAVVHDRYFIHKIADTIWEVKGNGIRIYPL
jgi:ATP-binding cassette subfamily F protein 3